MTFDVRMSEENRLRVVNAIERAFQDAGVADIAEGAAIVEKFAKFVSDGIVHFRDRRTLMDALGAIEIAPEEEMKFVTGMEKMAVLMTFTAPRVIRAIEKVVTSTAGRPAKLDSKQEIELCEYVAKLNGQGVELTTSKDRAAQKFGVSRSTVERVWLDRKKKSRRTNWREIWSMLFAD